MSRIVAIDYGRKRTGIAVSDTMQLIANGLTTVPTHELLNFIGEYIAKEPVERKLFSALQVLTQANLKKPFFLHLQEKRKLLENWQN
jgi:hypothetical protein